MKKFIMITIIIIAILLIMIGVLLYNYNSRNGDMNTSKTSETIDINSSKETITKQMAYEGVYNYSHSAYDWSIEKDNPSIMYLEMGEETESEYQVILRSYTGAFVYFYVDKISGITRLIEYVPTLNIKSEEGTINIFDYIKKE